jgi:signal transduction histidine kinase
MVVASAAVAVLVGIVFAVLVVAIREQRHSARLAIKSEQAITAGVSLEKLAIDLETGVRGFVASGNTQLLQPYTDARLAYPGQAEALEQLVKQDPSAHRQALAIRGAIEDYVNLYSIPIVSLAKDNLGVARSVIVNNTGRDRIDGIRRQFTQLFATERAIAKKRTDQANSRSAAAIGIGIGGLLVALASIVVLAIYLRRAIVRPVREVARGAERVAQGDLSARTPEHRSDEIGDLGRAFNTMAASLEQSRDEVAARTTELERSNRELDQFAAVTSHDLKEPLQTVTVFAGLLDRDYRDQLDESGRTFLDSILASADRMRALIRDLLEFSRVGHGELACEPVPADELVDRARSNLAGHISERGAVVTVEPLPTVKVEPNQLCQVFQNLLSNAVKFSDEELPEVHVSATREAESWRFSVRDNGIGIDPAQAERIFKPFARLGSSKDGTGIGLAICQRIVEHHGGRIWVESEPGAGSTFHFTIPGADGSPQSPSTPPERVSASSAAG